MQLLMKMNLEMRIKRKKPFNLNEEICTEGIDSKIQKHKIAALGLDRTLLNDRTL